MVPISPPPRRWSLLGLTLLAVGLLAAGPAESEPDIEVVRLRVPSDRVPALLPAGVGLRSLPLTEFEALVAQARAGWARQRSSRPPTLARLLRAHHRARWEDGVLVGESELRIVVPGHGPSRLPLVPWSPALVGNAEEAAGSDRRSISFRPRARAEGPTELWIDPAPDTANEWTVRVPWELQARAGSDGRVFHLEVPELAVSRLTLDVPRAWVPEGPAGLRQGPQPSPEGDDRALWSFHGPGGAHPVTLRASPPGPGSPEARPALWVGGPVRVDVGATSARWRADWTVDRVPGAPRQFTLELDPGLEPIEVAGPEVSGFQIAPRRGASGEVGVTIQLAATAEGPTPVTIQALGRVPVEGQWSIPSARPTDAIWTGGRTELWVGPERVVTDCRETGGRRVIYRPRDADEVVRRSGTVLVFEPRTARSVADVTFGQPAIPAVAEVRGQLHLDGGPPHFEARVRWSAGGERPLSLAVDLPPGWVPDRVELEERAEPVPWNLEPRDEGASRLWVAPPPSVESDGALTLMVAASAAGAGPTGRLALPRLRPVGAVVVDEVWLARAPPSLTIRPVQALGVAWIDPALVTSEAARPVDHPEALQSLLAWRWLSDAAQAVIDRQASPRAPLIRLRGTVVIDPDHLRLEWIVTVESRDQTIRTLPVHLSESLDVAPEWELRGGATSVPIPARPLDASQRAALGLPETGSAWELELPHPSSGAFSLSTRIEGRWDGAGRIPLLSVSPAVQSEGVVRVLVDHATRTEAQTDGLRVLDPALADRLVANIRTVSETPAPSGPAAYRRAHAFGYEGSGSRLALRTETLRPAGVGGLIQQAHLTTLAFPDGPDHQRLTLRVAAVGSRTLEVTLPPGATLQRATRDGQPEVPTLQGDALVFLLPTPEPERVVTTIGLDYTTPHREALSAGLRAERPQFSLPCLSLHWEVALPAPWSVRATGAGLSAVDPAPEPSWVERMVGPWASRWLAPSTAARRKAKLAVLRDLDERVRATWSAGPVTLGEWFARWDSGRHPLVLDRDALAGAGWGPRSVVDPGRLDARQPSVTRWALAPLGLTVEPLGGVLVITTPAEWPQGARAEAWERTVLQAVGLGSDASDRFQSVARWHGEPTPHPDSGRGLNPPAPAGRPRHRFVASGWSSEGLTLSPADPRTRAGWAWALGLTLLLVGLAARDRPASQRASALAGVLAVVLVVALAAPATFDLLLGALGGALGASSYWLGRSWRRRHLRPTSGHRSLSSRRPRPRSVELAPLVPLAVVLAVGSSGGRADDSPSPHDSEPPPRILALIPFDDLDDPAENPGDRVILRLDHFRQLHEWADAVPTPAPAMALAAEARHTIRRTAPREARVETEWHLWPDGPGPAIWSFPIGDGRDLVATLDDQRVPVRINAEGRIGQVDLRGEGPWRLRLQRQVPIRSEATGEVLRLAINPVATAQIQVEDRDASAADTLVEVAGARGRLTPQEGGVAGLLGPADAVEVHWRPQESAWAATGRGFVEGLILWDAEPVGDRVRARLTVHDLEGASQIRLRLEPGVMVRTADLPGLIDTVWQGSADQPEWVARVDPPLPPEATLHLELWRPRADAQPEEGELDAPRRSASPRTPRRLPRIEPLGVARVTADVAFRRPFDWTGRLRPQFGLDPLTEEQFVRSWGDLPSEPLTLSGTTRLVGVPELAVFTGPEPARRSVRPEVRLTIVPGRLELRIEADLRDDGAPSYEQDIEIDPNLRIVRITGDGLSNWTRPSADRLHLRFDDPIVRRQRVVRIEGWLPILADPLAAANRERDATVPWPRWPGASVQPGRLIIRALPSVSVSLETGLGVSALPAALGGEPSSAAPADGASSLLRTWAYRVERPQGLGPLRWTVPAPRLNVLVRSHLTLHPRSAQWVAVVDYQVSGGPCDTLFLELPTVWADAAEVALAGLGHRRATRAQGPTTLWTIRPEEPIWGTCQVVLRAERPIVPAEGLDFPDLRPRGEGMEATYLAVANATGWPLRSSGSQGLPPLDAARFSTEDLPVLAGLDLRAYRVRSDTWTLWVGTMGERRADPAREPAPRAGEATAPVALADLTCVLAADGALWGQARYELGARPGPFLPVVLPPEAEAVWALVEGTPTQPLQGVSGRWLVPLGDAEARHVHLIWRAAPTLPELDGERPIALPRVATAGAPTLVTVFAPDTTRVRASSGVARPIPPSILQVERLEQWGTRILDSLDEIDRSSPRDRARFERALIRFELLRRSAERSAQWGLAEGPGAGGIPEVHRQALGRAEAARHQLDEAIHATGLDEWARTARARLGAAPLETAVTPLESSETVQVPHIGRPTMFHLEGLDEGAVAAPLHWSPEPLRPLWLRAEVWAVTALAALAAILIVSLAARADRPGRLGLLVLALAVGAWALGLGPLSLAILAVLTGLGWLSPAFDGDPVPSTMTGTGSATEP